MNERPGHRRGDGDDPAAGGRPLQDDPSHSAHQRPTHEHSPHVISAAANLTGTCLAAAGIFRLEQQQQHINIFADNLAALCGLLYLIATVLAYMAVRNRSARLHRITERIFFGASITTAVLLFALVLDFVTVPAGH